MRIEIARREWRFVAWFTLGMLIVTTLPYIFGYLSCPADRVFMGIAYGVSDTAQYFAWMRGFRDSFIIDNHLTPEPNAQVFINPQWWLLAQLERILGLTHPQALQVLRLLAMAAFAIVVYWFVAAYFAQVHERRTAFALIQVGAGLGWTLVVLKYLIPGRELYFPLDVYAIEPNSFLCQMALPHFTVAASLIILILGLSAKALARGNWRLTLITGSITLLLGLLHAYDLLLIYVIVGLFTLFNWVRSGQWWPTFGQLVTLVAISWWPALYAVYITSERFPVWKAVLAQFDLAGAWTPDPFHLLVLLGIPFIVAWLGFDGLSPTRERSSMQGLVRIWFLANLFLVYLPVNFQIHYLNGWQVPIAILAMDTLYRRIIPFLRERSARWGEIGRRWLPIMLLLIAALTNVYLLAWRFVDLARARHPYYLHRDEYAALEWLAEHATVEDVVLCTRAVGQYVPGWTGARPFLGHWAMTKDLHQKQAMVAAFFDATTPDDERRAILERFSVDYVLWGTAERKLGDFAPGNAPYLQERFAAPHASVYCVRAEQPKGATP